MLTHWPDCAQQNVKPDGLANQRALYKYNFLHSNSSNLGHAGSGHNQLQTSHTGETDAREKYDLLMSDHGGVTNSSGAVLEGR